MEAAFLQGFASALLEVLFDKIATPALEEIRLILGVDDDLRKLERTLLRIQALIDHVEVHDSAKNKVWQALLEDLRGLSYSADDLLDEMSIEFSRSRVVNSGDNQVLGTVLSSFKLTKPGEISKLNKDMEDIAREMDSLFMTQMVKSRPTKPHSRRYSSSMVDERFVIGRDDDKQQIINMLLAEVDPESNVSVIPMVGMAGIGKTTLSQIVYNSVEVNNHFELKIWASVSLEFDVISITKSIIESVTRSSCNLLDLDPIQNELQWLLRGKRFLLVLDDLWNENYDNWDVLISPLRYGGIGSKVLVTSRSKIVSSIVGTTAPYHLQCLSDVDCWEVMKQRVFSNEQLDESENLQLIGMRIAQKCKGLPLAAKTLGSVLHFKYTEKEWNEVLTSELWDLPKDKNEIFPALLLSYHHLPAYLKICFYYCSIFHQNHDYEKDDLVLRWIAEGFIHPVGERTLEDIGCDYFNDLMWRCFFEYSHENSHGQPLYKMHAIIHNVAQLVSAGICFRIVDDMSYMFPLFKNARHLSLNHYNIHPIALKTFPMYKSLRTFLVMCQAEYCVSHVPCNIFLKMRCLRVLDLSRIRINELPDSIDHLIHLRYLNLSENGFQKLPESIANLFCLQTLKLNNCFKLLVLPKNLKNLTNLRHLDLDMQQLHSMPLEFGRLVNLQALNAFIVGKKSGYGIGELKNMKFLRGSICITGLENVLNVTQAKEAMLDEKPYFDKVELQWNSCTNIDVDEEVLAGLLPHKNLKELVVKNYNGLMFPSWLSDPNLCNLVNLQLIRCRPCRVLPPLGQLSCLKFLSIEDMHGLERVGHDFSGFGNVMGFPSLKTLKFSGMSNLTEWAGLYVNDMPHLYELTIVDCPRLVALPSLHNLGSLEKLEIILCSEVRFLPEEGLPTSLKTLIITECAILSERCKVEEGEDWSKVRNIPRVVIDLVEIPMQA